jgi:type II secretory pathway pseudopilin PulG
MHKLLFPLILALASSAVLAKLPPPSDEAKAKAAEAAAKTAHTAKVDAYLLCKSQDKVAAHVNRTNKAKAGKPVATAPCTDPGKFVYTPPEATPAAAAPAAAPAAPAAAPAAKKS